MANQGIYIISANTSAGSALPYFFILTVPLSIILFFAVLTVLIRDLAVLVLPDESRRSRWLTWFLLMLPATVSFCAGGTLYALHHSTSLQPLHAILIKWGLVYDLCLLGFIAAPITAVVLIARSGLPGHIVKVAISAVLGSGLLIGWIVADTHAGRAANFELYMPSSLKSASVLHFNLDTLGPNRYVVLLSDQAFNYKRLDEMKASSNDAYNSKTGLCLPAPYSSTTFSVNDYGCNYEMSLNDGTRIYKAANGVDTYFFVKNGTFIEFEDTPNDPPEVSLINKLVPAQLQDNIAVPK